jgi:hypothetical protein
VIHPTSFLLGLGAAVALPALTKILRPFAVEVAVAGMAAYEELSRMAAEQAEVVEDIVAEARAKRQAAIAAGNGKPHEDLSSE